MRVRGDKKELLLKVLAVYNDQLQYARIEQTPSNVSLGKIRIEQSLTVMGE